MDSINSIKVLSVDEENLKYRVIWTNNSVELNNTIQKGVYKFNLPPPTHKANSSEFSTCVIKCDSFTAYTFLPGAVGRVDPCWTEGAVATKIASLELRLNVGSSQTVSNKSIVPADLDVGQNRVAGFRQLIPLTVVNVGDSAIATPAAGGFAWTSINSTVDPLFCGNPFGQSITLTLTNPATDLPCFLGDTTILGDDIGIYTAQFTIELIKN